MCNEIADPTNDMQDLVQEPVVQLAPLAVVLALLEGVEHAPRELEPFRNPLPPLLVLQLDGRQADVLLLLQENRQAVDGAAQVHRVDLVQVPDRVLGQGVVAGEGAPVPGALRGGVAVVAGALLGRAPAVVLALALFFPGARRGPQERDESGLRAEWQGGLEAGGVIF
ncbi:hypothetical protein PG985_015722 [Apiospora marii]|uniref:uncharacterized protein n=1 Tax=Apiospora marii TaxID=335849 RepID=UPI003131D865